MSAMLPSFVSTLGWALIHFLWQGLLVGTAASIALMLLRNARPRTRYALSCAALALCMFLPMAGVWRGLRADVSINTSPAPDVVSLVAEFSQPTVVPLASLQSTLHDHLPWIVALWSIGAGLLALRMALGMTWVGRIGRSRSGTSDLRWQARLDGMATAFGMHRDIVLRVVTNFDSPVAAGWWRPIVLVPAALIVRMPADLLEALLAHELAHIKRHDYLINLIQSAIEALLFYHPVVWWLSRQVRLEREQIADDLATAALGEPRRLAIALHELAQFQLGNASYSMNQLSPAANGGNLMSRIQRLIRPSQHALSWRIALPIIGLTAICLTMYAQDVHDTRPAAAITAVAPESAPTLIAAAAPKKAKATSTQITGRTIHNSDRKEDGYAVVRAGKEGIMMSGDIEDIPAIKATKQKVRGDFVWVRRGQKTYVVQDPAIVARVVEAWEPTEPLAAQMDALSEKMEIPGKKMEALGKQMEALTDQGGPHEAAMEKTSEQMEPLSQQMEAIGEQMEALGRQMEDAKLSELDGLGSQMDALQQQMEPLTRQMETLSAVMEQHGRRMEINQEPIEALSRQMEEASKPMEALGEQMEVLGKQMEILSKEADLKVKALIDEAMRSGRVTPLE